MALDTLQTEGPAPQTDTEKNAGLPSGVQTSGEQVRAIGTPNGEKGSLLATQKLLEEGPPKPAPVKGVAPEQTLADFQREWRPGEYELAKEAQDLQKLQVLGGLRFTVQDMIKAAGLTGPETVEGETGPTLEDTGLTPATIADPKVVEATIEKIRKEQGDEAAAAITKQIQEAQGKMTVGNLLEVRGGPAPENEEILQILEGLGIDPNTATIDQVQAAVNKEIDDKSKEVVRQRNILDDPAVTESQKSAARQELIRQGASGLKSAVEQAEELEARLAEADVIVIDGEPYESLEEALKDPTLSATIANAFSEDKTVSESAIKQLDAWGLGELIEEYSGAISNLVDDLDQTIKDQAASTAEVQKLVKVGTGDGGSLQNSVLNAVLGKDILKEFVTPEELTQFKADNQVFLDFLSSSKVNYTKDLIEGGIATILNEMASKGDTEGLKDVFSLKSEDSIKSFVRNYTEYSKNRPNRVIIDRALDPDDTTVKPAELAAALPGVDQGQVEALLSAGLTIREVAQLVQTSFDNAYVDFGEEPSVDDLVQGYNGNLLDSDLDFVWTNNLRAKVEGSLDSIAADDIPILIGLMDKAELGKSPLSVKLREKYTSSFLKDSLETLEVGSIGEFSSLADYESYYKVLTKQLRSDTPAIDKVAIQKELNTLKEHRRAVQTYKTALTNKVWLDQSKDRLTELESRLKLLQKSSVSSGGRYSSEKRKSEGRTKDIAEVQKEIDSIKESMSKAGTSVEDAEKELRKYNKVIKSSDIYAPSE